MKRLLSIVMMTICLFSMTILVSCTSTNVSRVSSEAVIDLTGDWNDTDVRLVCDDLVNACLSSPRLARFEDQNDRLPIFLVGTFRNDSDEHIDTSIITSKMQNSIINSGRADFMASNSQRTETRKEIMNQQAWSNPNDAKSIANEAAADFMLQGSVKTIVQKSGKRSVRTYFVYAELIDIESGMVIWTDENDSIKKVVTEASVRL